MFRGICAPVMMRPLLAQDEDWPIAATLPTPVLVHQSVFRAAPYRTKACAGRRSMQGLTKRTKKEEAPSRRGGVCLSKMDRITDLELRGLTGFRDQVRTLVCARFLRRYSSPYIPRVGISRFARLRPYSTLAEVTCDIIKELRASPSRILWLRRETRSLCISTCRRRHPAQRARARAPADTAPFRQLDVLYSWPVILCQAYSTPMLSSDLLRSPIPMPAT